MRDDGAVGEGEADSGRVVVDGVLDAEEEEAAVVGGEVRDAQVEDVVGGVAVAPGVADCDEVVWGGV